MRIASVHARVLVSLSALFALALAAIPACRCGRLGPEPRPDAEVLVERGVQVSVDLAGVVCDSRGAPLPDALVIAWPKVRQTQSVVQAYSDEEGRFVLPRLTPGIWTLLVEAAGFGTVELERHIPDPSPLTVVLEGEGRSLTGLVVAPPNRPVAGAQVVLGGPGLRWPRQTTTNGHGIFSFSGLGMGRIVVRALWGSLVSNTTSLYIEEKRLVPVRLTLALGGFVEGTVRDDQGRELSDVSIDVLTIPSDDLPSSCRSDEQGHFLVGPLRPGRYQILARLEGHILLDAHEPLLGPGARATLNLRLARGARISGRVRDQDGAPIVGAPVSVVGLVDGHEEILVIPGVLPTAAEAAALPPGTLARPGSVRSALTDARGRFVLSGLAPGRARLEISPVDKLPLRREPLLLAPGDDRDLGELVVLTGVVLSGRVLGQDDQRLDDVQVEARALGRSDLPVRVPADSQGQFVLRVPVGQYTVSAMAKGHLPQTISMVRALGRPDPLEFRLVSRSNADAGTTAPGRPAAPALQR